MRRINGRRLMRMLHLIPFLGALSLAACGGGGGSSGGTTPPPSSTGQMAVSITDSAECGYNNVFVTVSKVRVHQSASAQPGDSGWIEITPTNAPVTIDLLTLQNGTTQSLGLASLPVAQYNQVRLVLVPNTTTTTPFNNYVVTNGTTSPLIIPAGFANGIKLTPIIDIGAGEDEELILDFDVCRSIVEGNNKTYHFRPRILTVRKAVAGGITGFIGPVGTRAVVKAELIGADGKTRYVYKETRVKENGSFRLYPLPNSTLIPSLFPNDIGGTFDIVIVSDTAATVLTTGVPVSAGADTAISTSTAPIALTTAGSGNVNGVIDPTSSDARVRQTIHGNTYQVRRHPLNPFNGKYDFTLSSAAPSFGTYHHALPISYAADNSATGKYALDTPSDDGLYAVTSQNVTVSGIPTTLTTMTLAPASGTAGSAEGTLTISSLPPSGSGEVLVAALLNDEIVNSVGVPVSIAGAVQFTIDDLAPGTYTLVVLHRAGLIHVTPATLSVTIPTTGGVVSNNTFTLTP